MTNMLTREEIRSLTYDNTTSAQPGVLRQMALALLDVDEAVRQPTNTADQTTLQCLLQREKEWCKVMEEYREQIRRAETERDEARDWVRRMHNESQILTCAFCGQAYPPGTPSANDEALREHVRVCEKHPLRTEAERLRAKADEARVDQVAAELREAALRAKGDALAEAAERRLNDGTAENGIALYTAIADWRA